MGRLVEAVGDGDQRAALKEAALLLAERIELAAATGAGTLAQEVAQFRQTLAELKALPVVTDLSKGGRVVSADEARLRREVRRAKAQVDAATGTSSG